MEGARIMAIKDILLHLDDSKAAKARIDATLALADAQGAHVTGLVAVAAPPCPAICATTFRAKPWRRRRTF
jgi:nucleotide-binding universal stress UspA family protein